MKNFLKDKISEKSDQDKKLDELERVISRELKKLDEENKSDQRWPKVTKSDQKAYIGHFFMKLWTKNMKKYITHTRAPWTSK